MIHIDNRRSSLLIIVLLLTTGTMAAQDPKECMIKVYSVKAAPDFANPWAVHATISTVGSGCILKDHHILTCAHVVANQITVEVRRNNQTQHVSARVVQLSHDADLALLSVEDKHFFDGVEGLDFGELPRPQQKIVTYGFPTGGDTLSSSEGITTRFEHQIYLHSSLFLLAGQVDATIDPGDSGGPVVVDGKIVGIIMQRNSERTAFMVPVIIIQHFIKDVADGHYDGFPSLGIRCEALQNPGMRRKYKGDDGTNGILVTDVIAGSPCEGQLRRGDVLLEIDGRSIGEDGTVEFRPGERTSYTYPVDMHQVGETVELGLFRDGRKASVTIVLSRAIQKCFLIPKETYEQRPQYMVYAGLVFTPLTKNYLLEWGENWVTKAPKGMVDLYLSRNYVRKDHENLVVLVKILNADVNRGYSRAGYIVSQVNGVAVHSFADFLALLNAPSSDPFITFTFEDDTEYVIDRAQAEKTRNEVLKAYSINSDRSADLIPAQSSPP